MNYSTDNQKLPALLCDSSIGNLYHRQQQSKLSNGFCPLWNGPFDIAKFHVSSCLLFSRAPRAVFQKCIYIYLFFSTFPLCRDICSEKYLVTDMFCYFIYFSFFFFCVIQIHAFFKCAFTALQWITSHICDN